MPEIKTRIAPSPSGFLHVGTARTAIYNWLYARNKGGKFVLRIEDTDADRSSREMVDAIVASLRWLGLDWDEGPLFQSERGDLYASYLDKILKSGNAYRCFCTPEELEVKREIARENKTDYRYDRTCLGLPDDEIKNNLAEGKPFVLRLKIPDGETTYDDLVYGRMVRKSQDIDDFVICRKDGRALYNFAVVVDDHEMGITDILRGNDHQTNTFKQVLIYRALGLEPPRFAHLPLIFDESKKKISKRHDAANASDYGKHGFLPDAVLNYLTLLGWSSKDDTEIFKKDELIRRFNVDGINKSNAVFDEKKMRYINGEHIKMLPNHELATMLAPLFIQSGTYTKYGLETRWKYFMDVVGLLKDRAEVLPQFVERGEYFFQAPYKYDEKGVEKQFTPENADLLENLAERFEKLADFGHDDIHDCLKKMAEERGLKTGPLIHPTRLAVTGMITGPGLFELLELIGQKEIVARMRTAVKYIRKKVPHG